MIDAINIVLPEIEIQSFCALFVYLFLINRFAKRLTEKPGLLFIIRFTRNRLHYITGTQKLISITRWCEYRRIVVGTCVS